VVPLYAGIEALRGGGESVQYGGRLCKGQRFQTADGRTRFLPVAIPEPAPRNGRFLLSTRRGQQLNSIA
jgi:hypothetical protein